MLLPFMYKEVVPVVVTFMSVPANISFILG